MKYFLDTTETIGSDVGFPHFGALHLIWLAITAVVIVLNCLLYRRLTEKGRKKWRWIIAGLLVADEIFKDVMLIIGNRFLPGYLPLHLCSINIILITVHSLKPSKILSGYLYTVGIPGAAAALLFPSWTSLPLQNFMHLHSFTVHILLVLYPIVLGVAGELRPSVRQLHKYLLLLVGMAIPIYGINLLLDTNFMFLMSADPGNPLYLFEQLWGNHIYGFPVLIAAVLIVMYVPLIIWRKVKKREI